MRIFDWVKSTFFRREYREIAADLLESVFDFASGNPVSAGKSIAALANAPSSIRDKLFWGKLSSFLDGAHLSEDDCAQLRAKLAEDEMWEDNSSRLVDCIDRAETHRKVQYLANATRCLLADFVDRSTYFRICHVVAHTLDEDLQYLAEHIGEPNLLYSEHVQGLLTSGLMYRSVINNGGDQKYSFVPFAETVDRYAVSYRNEDKYPDPTKAVHDIAAPQTELRGVPEWGELPSAVQEQDDGIAE